MLREIVGDAVVVGLGESTHGARQLFTAKDRVLRFLVSELGFRAVAWEEDWTLGRRLDAYVSDGVGDPRALLADAIIVWRTEEILDVLTWLRAFNVAHPSDKVRFVGVDVLSSRGSVSYEDASRAYAETPTQEAKVVLASHEFFRCEPSERFAFRDRQMAENTIWWHSQTGARVVYWAHNAHTANDPRRMSTGAHLRSHFGAGYVSVATTFHHGSVNVGLQTPQPVVVPPPDPSFADAAFGDADTIMDLRGTAPEPATIRAIGPTYDAAKDTAHNMTNGTLSGWFDAIVHVGEVTPSRMLT